MVISGRKGLLRVALALAVVPALLVGCDSGSSTPGVSVTEGGSVNDADLTIAVDNGSGKVTTWHLTCEPAGGDHPNPEAACAALTKSGAKAMPPVPTDRMCTQIYGGAQTATITGTWRGSEVDASFKRTNGCEIARWEALSGLLPPAPPAGAG